MNAPHRRSDAQDDVEGVSHVSMDCGFLGEKESETETQDDVGLAGSERAARFIDQTGTQQGHAQM